MSSEKVNEGERVAAQLPLYMPPEMKDIVEERARALGMSMTGWIVAAIAKVIERPDLAYVPRKKSDRPQPPPLPNGHGNGKKRVAV